MQKVQEKPLFQLGTCNLAPDFLAQLDYLTLVIGQQGRALISVNFKYYVLRANDILLLYDDSLVFTKRRSHNFSCFYCKVEKTLASEIAYVLPSRLFAFLQRQPHCPVPKQDITALQGWLQHTQYLVQNGQQANPLLLRNQLQNLFLIMSQRLPDEENHPPEYSRKQMLAWQFWEMIGVHCKQQREVAFYAEQLHITPFYLAQITKICFNETPKALIDRQVILEIKQLLSHTKLSIKQIAEQLNFNDPAYMNRYFKRYTGKTLSEQR